MNFCNKLLKVVTFDARLLDSSGRVVAAAPESHCHLLAGGSDCGRKYTYTTGSATGLSPGEYVLQSTARLVLNEPAAPDPWVVTPGTTPPDSTPADVTTRGVCAPGQLVVRCNVTLPITVTDGRVFLPRVSVPGTPKPLMDECTLNPFKYGCPGNPPRSVDPS